MRWELLKLSEYSLGMLPPIYHYPAKDAEEVLQNCFVLEGVKFKNSGSLADKRVFKLADRQKDR